MARIVPYNPIAFPPSMEVRTLMPQGHDVQDAYTDVGGRVMQEQLPSGLTLLILLLTIY